MTPRDIRNPNCEGCSLSKTAQFVCLIGTGSCPSDLVFIGEAPGQREDDSGKPFVGRAGKVLDLILDDIGLSRESIFIDNIVKCRPPENRDPSLVEVRSCTRLYLEKELTLLKPKLIICLGRWAAIGTIAGGITTIENSRRSIFLNKDQGIPVIVTYHPSICFHKGPRFGKIIADDIRWGIDKIINKKADSESDIHIETSLKHMDRLIESNIMWAIDTETNSKGLFDPELRIISGAAAYAEDFVICKRGEENPLEMFRKILSNTSEVVYGHSIKSDLKWLRKRGIKRKEIRCKIADTLIMASLCDENYPNRKLEHLATTILGVAPWKGNKEPKDMDPLELRLYNTRDVNYTYKLGRFFGKEIARQDLHKSFALDMQTTSTFVEVELKGIQIDQTAFKEMAYEYNRRIQKIKGLIGLENLESSQQVSSLLFNQIGLVPPEGEVKGKNGFYSTREAVLLAMQGVDPSRMPERILRYRMFATRKKMFLDGLDGQSGMLPHLDSKWRIHPNFNIAKVAAGGGDKNSEGGTTSGRTSCKNPNLQQFPREQEDIPRELNIRRMVISKYENGKIGRADYIQGEVVLAGSESNDPWILGILEKGGDFHKTGASEVLGKPLDDITKFERKLAKGVVFGTIYRGGPFTLSRKMGVDIRLVEDYQEKFKRKAKILERWFHEREEEIIENKQIRNSAGRIRHLSGASKRTPEGREAIRSGLNMMIQGLLGDITKNSTNKIQKSLWIAGMKSHVIGIIHDEILFDIYPGEEEDLAHIVIQIAEREPHNICKLQIPLKIEFKIGSNWLDVKELETNT